MISGHVFKVFTSRHDGGVFLGIKVKSSFDFVDMDFKPGSPSTMSMLLQQARGVILKIFKSTDSGENWTEVLSACMVEEFSLL